MKTIDFSYYIERYLAGEMSDTEKIWFHRELDGNEELQREVNLRRQTNEILRNKDIISLRNKLSVIEKHRTQTAAKRKPQKPGYIKYAAITAAIILLGSLLIFPGKKLGNEEIMNRYYKTYDPATTQRSYKVTSNDDFNQALEFYKIHDFSNAAIYFNKVVQSEPKNMYSTLLYGISNFEDKKYPEAKISFGKVISDNNNLYIDQAQWYLALCYINTNEKSKALGILEKITMESSIYKDDAKKIIKKLK
jgi:TolA-binding protein